MRGLSQGARDQLLYVAPVALVAVVGLAWIVFHASSGRGQIHMLFQLLALAEGAAALLLRRRKPAGALASILAVYVLVDLEPVTGLAVLLALLTLTMTGSRRAVALGAAATTMIVVSMPYLHGDHPTVAAGLARAAAVGCAVAAGSYLRARRDQGGSDDLSGPVSPAQEGAHPAPLAPRR
jgi:hypothetical protein